MATDHTVREGESVQSLAHGAGLFWETVWRHPNNSALKTLRKDPDVLLPGDTLHIPDLQSKTESGGTEARHVFRRKGTPAKFVMVLTTRIRSEAPVKADPTEHWCYAEPVPVRPETEPRAQAPFCLYADGTEVLRGTTDDEGRIEARVPAGASHGRLVVDPGSPREQTIELRWRQMDPVEDVAGVCKRLNNLGYAVPVDAQEDSFELSQALLAFQSDKGLDKSGELTQATRDKLKTAFGG